MSLARSGWLLHVVFAQAAAGGDLTEWVKTFLTAGVAGAVVLGAIFGFIFFKPERAQLLETIEDLRSTADKYIEIHQNMTLPTLTKALTQFESAETTLKALTRAWEDQTKSNGDIGRRLDAIERRLEIMERIGK
jgi:hypothetical protein